MNRQNAYVSFNLQAMDGLVVGWYRRVDVIPPPGSLAHALHDTYATLLVDAGASLPEVQRLLGHADLTTTQVYLKVAGRGLEEAAMCNPARALLGRHEDRRPAQFVDPAPACTMHRSLLTISGHRAGAPIGGIRRRPVLGRFYRPGRRNAGRVLCHSIGAS
jgi:hypothetical protein